MAVGRRESGAGGGEAWLGRGGVGTPSPKGGGESPTPSLTNKKNPRGGEVDLTPYKPWSLVIIRYKPGEWRETPSCAGWTAAGMPTHGSRCEGVRGSAAPWPREALTCHRGDVGGMGGGTVAVAGAVDGCVGAIRWAAGGGGSIGPEYLKAFDSMCDNAR